MNENSQFIPIDLSKLKPCELPIEMIEIRLKDDCSVDEKTGGKVQNIQRISIHPISGAGMIAWGMNSMNDPDSVTFEERACLTALIYGAEMSEEQAKVLMNYDRETATAISQCIWVATSKWNRIQKEEAEIAEKNFVTAEMNTQG